jgi:hypothetical protein
MTSSGIELASFLFKTGISVKFLGAFPVVVSAFPTETIVMIKLQASTDIQEEP